jgi:hypothetical protein
VRFCVVHHVVIALVAVNHLGAQLHDNKMTALCHVLEGVRLDHPPAPNVAAVETRPNRLCCRTTFAVPAVWVQQSSSRLVVQKHTPCKACAKHKGRQPRVYDTNGANVPNKGKCARRNTRSEQSHSTCAGRHTRAGCAALTSCPLQRADTDTAADHPTSSSPCACAPAGHAEVKRSGSH